jgi:hypothetical protein
VKRLALLAVALLGLVAAAEADPAVRLKVSRSIVAGHVARLIGLELVARTNHGALSIVRALSRRERRTAGASC